MVLGIRYRQTADGQFNHSNVLTLLDRQGIVNHRQEGLATDVAPIAERIRGMLTAP